MSLVTLASAFVRFEDLIRECNIDREDGPMMSEEWSNLTDSMQKDGELTALQYHYCPSWDDMASMSDDWEEEFSFILDGMGVSFDVTPLDARTDGAAFVDGTHWEITIQRANRAACDNPAPLVLQFSKGSGLSACEPSSKDVFESLLMDISNIGSGREESHFAAWADDLGLDEDSRSAYKVWQACCKHYDAMQTMFDSEELSDLQELVNEY